MRAAGSDVLDRLEIEANRGNENAGKPHRTNCSSGRPTGLVDRVGLSTLLRRKCAWGPGLDAEGTVAAGGPGRRLRGPAADRGYGAGEGPVLRPPHGIPSVSSCFSSEFPALKGVRFTKHEETERRTSSGYCFVAKSAGPGWELTPGPDFFHFGPELLHPPLISTAPQRQIDLPKPPRPFGQANI